MTYSMDAIRVNAYNAMLHHLAEQRGSKLKGLFVEEAAKGENHFFDRIGAMSVSEITSLNTSIVNQDGAFSRRMCNLQAFDASTLVHDIEKMKMVADPTSDLVVKLMNAHGKNFDTIIINALLGTAATGKAGAGTASFDSNNTIAHGSAAFSVAKLNTAIQKLQSADVDFDSDPLYLIISGKGMKGLMEDAKFTSADYQELKPLAGRSFPMYRGLVNIVQCERLPEVTANTTQRAILCTGSALKIARGIAPEVDVSQRKDLQDLPWQIYTKQAFGAVRMEEALVVDINFQQA